jgi:hypothetical protein
MKQAWKMSSAVGAVLIVVASCVAPRMPPHPPKPPTPPRPPHGPAALPQQDITDLSIAYPQK